MKKIPSPLRPKRKKRKLISRFSNQQTSKKNKELATVEAARAGGKEKVSQ